jgi:hypothetical protein
MSNIQTDINHDNNSKLSTGMIIHFNDDELKDNKTSYFFIFT